jgi:hypothetical protein
MGPSYAGKDEGPACWFWIGECRCHGLVEVSRLSQKVGTSVATGFDAPEEALIVDEGRDRHILEDLFQSFDVVARHGSPPK